MTNRIEKSQSTFIRPRFIKLGVMLVFCFLVMIPTAFAQDKMVIGGLVAPPYIIVDDNKKVSGILVHLIRSALSDLDIEVEFKITNWARAFDSAKHGRADALIPTIKSPDRESVLTYPNVPLAILEMCLLKSTEQQIDFNGNLSTLAPYRIGRIRNARVSPAFDEAAEDHYFKLEERASFDLLAKAVAHGRLDLAAGDELMMLWAAANNGVLNNVEIIHPHLANTFVYLAISKKSIFANRVDEISKSIELTKSSQGFQNTIHAYEKLLKPEVFEHLMKNSLD